MQIDPVPQVKVNNRKVEIFDPFIPTGNYNPETKVITLYVNSRHLKDILRTFCHELVHHNQYLTNPESFMSINKAGTLQENDELTRIESDAYNRGNILFRKWTESHR